MFKTKTPLNIEMSDSGMKEIWEIYVHMENIENLIFIDFLSD
jgi:hypothetical protein